MAARTYAQGLVKRVINMADYSRKHSNKLAAANLPASITAAITAIQAAEQDAKTVQNTYNP